MFTKEKLLSLLQGKFETLSEELSDKAGIVTSDMVEQLGEELLNEMTPGHKEMMKQHIDAVSVVDYDADGSGKAKAKKTADGRIKNPKRPDERDEYNELGDFEVSKGKAPKVDSKPNFGAKRYTQNERVQRTDEAMERIDELSKATLGSYINKASDSQRSNAVMAKYYDNASGHAYKENDVSYAKKLTKKSNEAFSKSVKRRLGIQSAVKKLTKEEMEPLEDNLKEENGYICFYDRRRVEVHATTSYEAQKKAQAMLKVPEKKRYLISVHLAEKDGKQVTHRTSDL